MNMLRAVLAALFFVWSAISAPAMLTVSELHGFNAGGPLVTSISFVGCTENDDDLTEYTFTNHSTGAGPRTHTLVGVAMEDNGTVFSTSTLTVGGASASEIVDEDGTGLVNTSLHIIANPSGTTATIVVTASEAVRSAVVCVWQATLSSATPVSSIADDDTASGALVLTLSSTAAAGVAFGMCASQDGGASTTWANLSERIDDQNTEGTLDYSAADASTVGGSLAVTCDWTGSSDATGVAAALQ